MSDENDGYTAIDGGGGEKKPRDYHNAAIEAEPAEPVLGGADRGVPPDVALARYRCQDAGNAKRFLARHGEDLLFVEGLGWHVWDGRRWAADGNSRPQVERRAWAAAQAIYDEATAWRESLQGEDGKVAGDLDMRQDKVAQSVKARADTLVRHAKASCKNGQIGAMIGAAKPWVFERVEALNADPWRLTVANGTLHFNLARGRDGREDCVKLEPHGRSMRITKAGLAAYNPDAEAPEWDKFLKQVFPDDDVRLYAQRIAGYALMGENPEAKIFLLKGVDGRNGKGVFTRTIKRALGDYAVETPMAMWLKQREERPGDISAEREPLVGARLALAVEADPTVKLGEAMIKRVSGGDEMQVRPLHQSPFEFVPQFTLMLSLNNQPQVEGADAAIWNRIAILPFYVSFHGNEDLTLEARLRRELDGVLAWLVEGWRMWAEQGLSMPASALEERRSYQAENDPVAAFLSACCVRKAEGRVRSSDLYIAYKNWAAAQGDDNPMTLNRFGRRMNEKPIKKVKEASGMVFRGLELRPASERGLTEDGAL